MKTEEPVTVVDPRFPDNSTKTTHPAFAQIRAGRVHGFANLYGSDFLHNDYITITISKSELHRDLHSDMPLSKDDLIQVQLSEAQWATFVSSFSGNGIPLDTLITNRFHNYQTRNKHGPINLEMSLIRVLMIP